MLEKIKLFKNAISVTLLAVVISSCAMKKEKAIQNEIPDHHTAQNSLDWQGRYFGELPCADCERIETELSIENDLTYTLIQSWIKNGEGTTDTLRGKFYWQGNTIKLDEVKSNQRPSLFMIEENRIRQLDIEGNKITGDLETAYLLHKMGNPFIEDKRWQIIELQGKEVIGTTEQHYLIFHAQKGQLEAKANCNMMLMNYRITNQNRITINQGISTKMACPDNLESELIKALIMADNFTISEKTLSINKGEMTGLIRLKLVEN